MMTCICVQIKQEENNKVAESLNVLLNNVRPGSS